MENKFTLEITKDGIQQTLIYNGKEYVKRYKKDSTGYVGLDKSWDSERLPEGIVENLSFGEVDSFELSTFFKEDSLDEE